MKHGKSNKEQLPEDKTDHNTIRLTNEEIERMPDSGDDYRLPQALPEPVGEHNAEEEPENQEELTDDNTNISPEELALLDSTDYDSSSDESRASDLLEDTDDDGDELNEGPDEDSLFDTGEDLDMPANLTNPDMDIDEEEE